MWLSAPTCTITFFETPGKIRTVLSNIDDFLEIDLEVYFAQKKVKVLLLS